ncbi:hypothetical protein ACFUNF_27115 [Streptomyces sp. NPDC057291]|uniref:hypothetical protein n=1 Tax=Streptomyces sp. NPDC057291 TaxID=3346087 RepID=UPI003644BC9B
MTVGRGAWKRVIGRTWTAIVELPDGIKPANWHVALDTIVDDDGFERKIVRENMTSGRVGRGDFGSYFIGDARKPAGTERSVRPPTAVTRSRLIRAGCWTPPRSGRRPSAVASSCPPVAATPRPGRGNRLHGARRERIELYFHETLTYTDEAVVVLEA